MPIFQPSVSSLKDKRDSAALIKLLKGKDERTRLAAIKALGEIAAQPAVAPLAELIAARDISHAERLEAVQALRAIAAPESIPLLLQAVAVSRQRERERINTANTDAAVRPGLSVNLIATEEYTFRSAIGQALAQIGGEAALRALFTMLGSETGPMGDSGKTAYRGAIVEVLDKMQAGYMQVLYDELGSEQIEARQFSAEQLSKYNDAETVNRLIELAYDESAPYVVRQTTVASLGRIGDKRALPCLEELSQSPNRALARDARFNALAVRQGQKPVQPD